MPTLPATFPWFSGYVPPDGLATIEGTDLAWIDSHGDAGVALLLSQFRDKPKIEALLRAFLDGMQDLENAIYQVLTERWIDTAVGAQLDELGGILDLPRTGWGDETYRIMLRAQVRVLRSSGTWPDLLGILDVIGVPLSATSVSDSGMAEARVVLGDYLSGDIEALDAFGLLERARPGGVRLTLEYPTTASATSFRFGDAATYPTSDSLRGLGDAGDSSVGGRLGGVWASSLGV